MTHQGVRNVLVAALVLLAGGAQTVEAQYRYGGGRGYRSRGGGEQGFFAFVDAALTNPRNTDSVAATALAPAGSSGATTAILPAWDDEFTGRVGAGYQWSSGNRVSASYWSFETDQDVRGAGTAGGSLAFAIGPPIPITVEHVIPNCQTILGTPCILTEGAFVDAGSPGFVDLNVEIKAQTIDAAWGRDSELSDDLSLEWSAGLRYAAFEETMTGVYDDALGFDPGAGAIQASKKNEGEMVGARLLAHARYQVRDWLSFLAGLGLSLLDGEVKATSSLVPAGTIDGDPVPPTRASLDDDGRSGSILDVDLAAALHFAEDRYRVTIGWEQSRWNDLSADLVRNLPGTSATLRERDSVTFSGYKVGLRVRF
jgi:hypothetical protein